MRTPVLTVVGAVILLAGCSSAGTPTAALDTSSNITATASVATTDRTLAPSTYSFSTVRVVGSTGRVKYDVGIPRIDGPDPAVVEEFNESMRTALQDQIDGFDDARFSLSDALPGPTYVGSSTAGAVLNTLWDASPPGAHPSYIIATVTVNTDTAAPITLQDIFPDLQAGLQRLSEQSALLSPATAAGPDFEPTGIEPVVDNFANWVPSADGMNIRFGDYQVGPHAIGLVDVTFPWTALSDVADPGTLDVLSR